jgi:hypothetical protein
VKAPGRSHAGAAIAGCGYRLCPRSSCHAARTTVEAGGQGVSVCTTRRPTSARFLPVSTSFPPRGSSARRCTRLTPSQDSRTHQKCLPSATVVAPLSLLVSSLLQSDLRAQNSAIPSPDQPQLPDYNPLSTSTLGPRRASCIMRVRHDECTPFGNWRSTRSVSEAPEGSTARCTSEPPWF